MKNSKFYSRRQMIKSTAAFATLTPLAPWWEVFGAARKKPYRIGACDWSLGKGSAVEALAVARQIGLDGVQVSLGTAANDMHLRRPDIQQAYRDAAKKYGVQVAGLAIGELNRVPYKSAPETEAWVSDSIDVAQAMNCKVILLAFFDKGDLKGDKAGQQEVIARLRKVAPKAERVGVILGIESWLSAREHLDLIEAVGSKNVRVYYDVANAQKMGYDIYAEMAQLGSAYICEVHAKENDSLLGQGKVDFTRVRQVLDDMGYAGWVQIEGARSKNADLLTDYKANRQFLQAVLNT